MHRVAVGEGPVQAFEHDGGHAVAADGAVGRRVEGAAASAGRQDRAGVRAVAGVLGGVDGGGAGQGDVGVAAEQGLGGEVHRHQ